MKSFSPKKHILFSLLKVVIILLVMIGLFVVGVMVGYGYVGHKEILGVFEKDTWQHIFDFLK